MLMVQKVGRCQHYLSLPPYTMFSADNIATQKNVKTYLRRVINKHIMIVIYLHWLIPHLIQLFIFLEILITFLVLRFMLLKDDLNKGFPGIFLLLFLYFVLVPLCGYVLKLS